jgi:hypothetical protein
MLGWSRAIVPWSWPHAMPTYTSRPPTTPTYIYIPYMYIERQDGSDVRNLLRARGIGASADPERRQSSCRRPGTHTYMSIQFQISQG